MKKVKISLALTAFCAVMISVSALAQKKHKFTFASPKLMEKNEWTGKSVKVEGEFISKMIEDTGDFGYFENLVFLHDNGKEILVTNALLMADDKKKKLELHTLATTTFPKGISKDLVFNVSKNTDKGTIYTISLDPASDAILKSEVKSLNKQSNGKYQGRQATLTVGPFNEADLEKFKSRFK